MSPPPSFEMRTTSFSKTSSSTIKCSLLILKGEYHFSKMEVDSDQPNVLSTYLGIRLPLGMVNTYTITLNHITMPYISE